MQQYWLRDPPQQLLVHYIARYLGFRAAGASQPLEELSEYVPVNAMSEDEFNHVLAANGLPI